MQFSDDSPAKSDPLLSWQRIAEWAQTHYRDRFFSKDEQIPVRSGLLYLVNQGVVRLVGTNQSPVADEDESNFTAAESPPNFPQANFLGFVSSGQPFEIVARSDFQIRAYAHWEQTHVIWLYWQDLTNWQHFRQVRTIDSARNGACNAGRMPGTCPFRNGKGQRIGTLKPSCRRLIRCLVPLPLSFFPCPQPRNPAWDMGLV